MCQMTVYNASEAIGSPAASPVKTGPVQMHQGALAAADHTRSSGSQQTTEILYRWPVGDSCQAKRRT